MPGAAKHLHEMPWVAGLPERGNDRKVNVLEGLELHEAVLTEDEEAKLVKDLHALLAAGGARRLPGETYTKPPRTKAGNGRATMQFGCAYEYREGNGFEHGIKPDRQVGAMPACLVSLVARLVASGVLPTDVVPDSAIVNSYAAGDCIPPHGEGCGRVPLGAAMASHMQAFLPLLFTSPPPWLSPRSPHGPRSNATLPV